MPKFRTLKWVDGMQIEKVRNNKKFPIIYHNLFQVKQLLDCNRNQFFLVKSITKIFSYLCCVSYNENLELYKKKKKENGMGCY